MTNRRAFSILAIITICGFLFRLFFLLNRGPLWFDELWSVHFSSLPWTDAWRYWVIETNPFLYTLIMRGLVYFFGDSANAVRFFSLIVGTACIPLTYVFARTAKLNITTSLVAATLLTVSQGHVFYSSEARTYALLCVLATVSFIFLLRSLSQKSNNLTITLYGITLLLALYSHLTALTLVPIHFFIIILSYRQEKISLSILKKILLTVFTTGILFAFWFIPSFGKKMNLELFNGWYFANNSDSGGNILHSITSLFTNSSTPATGLLIFGVLCLIAFFGFVDDLRDPKKFTIERWSIFMWALFPIMIAACFGQYVLKFFVYCLPAIVIVLSVLGDRITDTKIRAGYYLIIITIPLATVLSTISYTVFEPSDIVNFLNKKATPNSLILINPFHETLTWERYYHGPAKLIGAYPIDDKLNSDERIARYNWQKIQISENSLKKWYEEKLKINQFDKIFFIEPYEKPSENVVALLQMGWRYVGKNIGTNSQEHYINHYVHELLPPITRATSTPSVSKNKSR